MKLVLETHTKRFAKPRCTRRLRGKQTVNLKLPDPCETIASDCCWGVGEENKNHFLPFFGDSHVGAMVSQGTQQNAQDNDLQPNELEFLDTAAAVT